MYTQCPECKSIFEISAADLAVAGGFVRCGQCTSSFDALNSLSDNKDAVEAKAAGPGAVVTDAIAISGTKTDVAGSAENVAMETDSAERDAAEPGAAEPGAAEPDTAEPDTAEPDTAEPDAAEPDAAEPDAAEPDTAEPDTAETDAAETGSAETGSAETPRPDELADDDEILLDDAYEPPFSDEEFFDDEEAVDAVDDHDNLPVAVPGETGDLTSPEFDEQRAETFDDSEHRTDRENEKPEQDKVDQSALFSLPLPELTALEHPEHGILPEKLEGGEAARDPSAQAQLHDEPVSTPVVATTPATTVVSPWLRTNDAFDAEDAHDLRDYLNDPVNPVTRAAWFGGSVLMALLLIGQVVHRYRGDLVIHPRFGPVVQSLYKSVGVDLRPNWHVRGYKVVGQARLFLMPLDPQDTGNENAGETAEGEAEDSTAIRFVTIISNDAKLPQPAPLVRLTLRNRWGDATGSRDFTPPEYLADRTMIGQLLEPGQRLRIVLNLYDFSSDAVGFDFDMCLPDDTGALRCADEG